MSTSPENPLAPELLDLHLGRLSQAEQGALRARIAADPQLAEQDAALSALFRALGHLRQEPAPADLAARTCARVAAAGPTPRVIREPDELTPAAEQPELRVIRLGSLREIIAVAAVIVLMVGLGVPSMVYMRGRSQRMGCTANLLSLGRGVQQYASTFNDSLPFAGWSARSSWRPSYNPAVVTRPNRQHVYLLLPGAYVADPRVFICPARSDVPMPRDQVARHRDFIESRNVSYAYYNMAGKRPSLQNNPNLPIMADDNPLFEDGVQLFDTLRFGDPANRNSRAHGGAGQNILTLDGHVKWFTTPRAGIDGDNIWTLKGVETYTGREGPKSPTDAHLLK